MQLMPNFALVLSLLCCGLTSVEGAKQRVPALNSVDPGSCGETTHGEEVLIKGRTDEEIIVICVQNKEGVYQWKPTDGSKNTVGEFFNPGLNCSDILDKLEDAKDGYYWITLKHSKPIKVYCDMTTDGGGFMLVGRKTNSITWTVPSNGMTVKPDGKPHWSSSLGNAPILDFRIQMATRNSFKTTKAHWFYRLRSKRPLKQLMVNTAECDKRSAGIGDIAYVKDLLTGNIVTTVLRCSKFGFDHHSVQDGYGWRNMNSCLQKPCPRGFAYDGDEKDWKDDYGGFSFSTTGSSISGMENNATAFVGCDNGICCGCYGPVGGTKDYCAGHCKAINGGTLRKNVFTWFWVRSSLPKRLWKKCMDYQVKRNDGKLIPYKLVGHSVVPVEGRCGKDFTLLHDGIVVAPDSSAAQKVPEIDGLLEFRKDKQELRVRLNKTWNVLAPESKILQETKKNNKLNFDRLTKELVQNFNNENKIVVEEMNKKYKLNLDKIKKLQQNLTDEKKFLENLIKKHYNRTAKKEMTTTLAPTTEKEITTTSVIPTTVLPQHRECLVYKWLNESNRNRKFSQRYAAYNCDKTLSTGWYRFGGGAGIKMATTCSRTYRCGTNAPGWMVGAHPTVAQGKVEREVCYHWSKHGCCQFSNDIEVLNCGKFYVYKLYPAPACYLRYCGSNN